MTLSPSFLDELRSRTLLSALIGKSVKIQRAGREFKACCPFHNEKTPSFTINDEKGFYHCFGCGAHGDAIRWLTDQRGLPFMEAVKELADAAGMAVPAPDPRAQERAERAAGLHDVMASAQDWFVAQLAGAEGASARTYLEGRGIKPALAKAFGFGLAPDARGRLRAALSNIGDAKLIEAGLLVSVDDKEPYDRFRGRLMIPIRDQRGRVIAFGGRILGDGEPKYLNSPETPLFDKGRTLFNIDKAGPASRETGRILVVEGYMDVVALANAGIGEAVAPLGTALTERQLEQLWRLTDTPLLCFDGDAAGQKAAVRAAKRSLPILVPGKSLDFAALAPDQDPDDLVQSGGAAAIEAVFRSKSPLFQILYRAERESSNTATPDGRASLRTRLDALANTCSHLTLQQEYRRSFNGLFWDEFGWKRSERKAIGSSILKTGPRGDRWLLNLFVRSALYGMSCFPQVAASHLNDVAQIQMTNDDLLRWRETLVEAVLQRPSLDADAVRTILESSQLSRSQRNDMSFDLRFPHTRAASQPELAMARLASLVEFLSEEQGLEEEMDRLDMAAASDPTLQGYDAIEMKRQILRERRLALLERGYDLGTDEIQMG